MDLLPEVARYWRHYSEYFELLANFAKIGTEEKSFLLARRTISRSIDSILLDESLSNSARNRNNVGDQFAVPDYNHLLTLISTLVRSVKLERDVEDDTEPVPTQICDAGPLDPACSVYIKKVRLLTKALSEGINPSHTMKMLEHMSWNNSKQSVAILETLLTVLDDAHEDEMDILLKMLEKLVLMKDTCQELRAQHMVALLLRMVLDQVLYADTCSRCLNFLENLVAHNHYVRVAALKLIINPRRDQEMPIRWFEVCLIRGEVDKVQMAWEKFARTLALPEMYLQKIASQEQQAKGNTRLLPLPKVHGDEYTKALFEHLVTKDDKMVLIGCADPRETGCGMYPLRYYFKFLCYVIENTNDRWYKDKFRERFRLFHQVLRRLNENEAETDYAKAELLRLMLLASDSHPEILDVYTDEQSTVRNTLVSNFILIRPHRINIAFNRQHLPYFYRLLLVCCQHSTSFIEHLMEANELIWAITHLMCKSPKYPETCAVMLQLIDVILTSEAAPVKLQDFRERVLHMLLNAKDLSANPESVVELSHRLALHLTDDTDGLYKVLDSQLIDALLAAVGACNFPVGQRQRTQIEARSFIIAMLAMQILNRILNAAKSTAAVDVAVREDIEKALKDALQRSKSMGCDHRHKAVSAIMFVVLPTVDMLSRAQRLMTLRVATALCAYDLDCGTAGVDALLKLYDETKLKHLELVRIEHLQGKTQQDAAKPTEAGADGHTGGSKLEQAWRHIASRAQIPSISTVIEYGPACRARVSGQGATAEEHKEVEAAYGNLALTLCKSFITIARNSNDHMRYAVHLILKCALDLLPLAAPSGHSGMQELLLQCVMASSRSEGEEGAPAEDAGEASAEVSVVPKMPLFVQLLRQETLAFDWVERVMLCYKEALEARRLDTCVCLLLRTLEPVWSAKALQRINHLLVADVTDVANAAATLKEDGSADTVAPASQRAECVARALLRELRPLKLVDQAPVMLALLIEGHGDQACVSAAEEALEAADCRKLASTSKILPNYLSEIDAILQVHLEAVKVSKALTAAARSKGAPADA